MSWPSYQPAGACTRGAQSGAKALMDWAVGDFRQGARNYGIHNCRNIRGRAVRSVHGEGRAIDVGFSGSGNPAGTRLLNLLLPKVGELGIQMIIWNRRIYSARYPKGAPYSGTVPHTDHLHIELTWNAAKTLTRDKVRRIISGGNVAPPPPAPDWAAIRRWNAGVVYNDFIKVPDMDGSTPRSFNVGVLQNALNIVHNSRLLVDGIYGPATIAAVLRFQTDINKLEPGIIKDFPGAAHASTRWMIALALRNIRDGKA